MKDYSDHTKVLAMIKKVQDAESDQREAVKEAKTFLSKRDGQWDADSWDKMDGRFRGTFDMCTPIIDQVSGEIEQSDFTLRVSPTTGEEDTAKILDGMIRNIRNISNAESIFQTAGRNNVIGGFDCWEVTQDFIDGDSFDQDLFIKPIPDASQSVWFDPSSVLQDRSDANWGVKLTDMPKDEYLSTFPKGSGNSVGNASVTNVYWEKIESVRVGKLYYRKPRNIEIVRMTDGSVYKVDDDFKAIQDELANPIDGSQPITIEKDAEGNEKRRTRKAWRVYTRVFDGNDWLKPEEETVFDYIQLIPVYGNFDIIENTLIYFGKIEKLYDEQRSLNYAMSRDIEDGALSPSSTTWMTEAQAEGHDYSTMNVDHAPIRTYNADPLAPPPIQTGGPMASQGLQTTVANMQQLIAASSNTFAAGQGNALAGQSGIAGSQQIDQGNIGSMKWFKDLEVAICHTGKVLINAIPRVYDATRQVRILAEDGSSKIETLNQPHLDQQTGKPITLNDLSIGEYDVVCDVGPAFNSQQKETAQALLDAANIDPTLFAQNKDIWLKNQSSPGMDLMAERAREQLFKMGEIPESQLTDEERQRMQEQQNQPPQPDPMMLAAEAEMQKGQAEMQNAQNKQMEIQGNQQLKAGEIQLKNRELDLDIAKFERLESAKYNVDAAKIDQGQQKLDQDTQKMINDFSLKLTDMEQKYKQQLDGEMQSNMLVFDASVGDFVKLN